MHCGLVVSTSYCVKFLSPFFKKALFDGFSHTGHKIQIIVKIVNGIEAIGQKLPSHEKMAQIGPREAPTGVTGASGFYGIPVFGVAAVLDLNTAP